MQKLKTVQVYELRGEYAPYDRMPEFNEGYADYNASYSQNPHPQDGSKAQAWDRGYECAMRVAKIIAS